MKRVVIGENDLRTWCEQNDRKDLLLQWDISSNEGLSPETVAYTSNAKVWWKCNQGHKWQSRISPRTKGVGCPYCSGHLVIEGVNDLNTLFPDIAREWHPTKNMDLSPSGVMPGSDKKVWWKCVNEHEWEARIANRTRNGRGCPFCSGKLVISGVNDLATLYPELVEEWDSKKNGDMSPSRIMSGSNQKVWWKCSKGHEWITSVNQRTHGTGCPYCSNKKVLAGFNDLATTNPNLTVEWNYEKNEGIKPSEVVAGSGKKVWWRCSKGHEWEAVISSRASKESSRKCPFCSGKRIIVGETDLQTTHPTIAKEWDYEKNYPLTPLDVSAGSEKNVWWKGTCGHSWNAMIGNRTRLNGGCTVCSSHKLLKGINDLQSLSPELSKEWHPTKNGVISPSDVFLHAGKKYWWMCAKGHEWRSSVNHRSQGRGCPYCSAEKHTSFPEQAVFYYVSKCFNITENRHRIGSFEVDVYLPEVQIAIEYDGVFYHNTAVAIKREKKKTEFFASKSIRLIRIKESDRNTVEGDIIYYNYDPTYKQLCWAIEKLFGLLDFGGPIPNLDIEHDRIEIYQQYVNSEKENSLAVKFPEIAKHWNYKKNGMLDPTMVSYSSGKTVWWICSHGHEWQAFVYSRLKSGCPYCSGKRVIRGENDLATIRPDLVAEWNNSKNGNLALSELSMSSREHVWWRCSKGHEWKSRLCTRIKGDGCPYCTEKYAVKGVTDLCTTHPNLVKEWNYEKNSPLMPTEVSAGSGRKIWWKCTEGHEWEASISNRTRSGCGCPYCADSLPRQVLCIETGMTYRSLSEAAKTCGLKSGDTISLCCRGKRDTAGGFHWEFVSPMIE